MLDGGWCVPGPQVLTYIPEGGGARPVVVVASLPDLGSVAGPVSVAIGSHEGYSLNPRSQDG